MNQAPSFFRTLFVVTASSPDRRLVIWSIVGQRSKLDAIPLHCFIRDGVAFFCVEAKHAQVRAGREQTSFAMAA